MARPSTPRLTDTPVETTVSTCRLRSQVSSEVPLNGERNLLELTSQHFPDERLVVCRNPLLAEERARKRLELLAATEADLANGGSDSFIDQMVLSGTAEQVKAGLRAHFAAGATHVAIQPVHAPGDTAARDAILKALADT